MSAPFRPRFSRRFRRIAAGLAASLALGAPVGARRAHALPADFRSSQVVNADATINVRVGGHGPAVVLIHGFRRHRRHVVADGRRAREDHTVVVPDLRGMGLSSHPAGGYDKWTQAGDIAPSSTSSASTAPTSWATTSARWSRMPTRRAIRTRQAAWS